MRQDNIELHNYNKVSNEIVGVIFLTLFLGSLGTDNPQQTAIFLSPIGISALFHMLDNYPTRLKNLKDKIKKETNQEKKQMLKKIQKVLLKKYFPVSEILTKHGLYLWSTTVYFLLVIFPGFGQMIKSGKLIDFFP